MINSLKKDFYHPNEEFSPIPFWFWNDELNEKELERQILDFKSKGVNGFVIHPRIGISKDIEYLSDRFMELVRFAVELADKENMKVVLYDEAMYPSGSAHGMVVKDNPEFASRGIKMTEYPCEGKSEMNIPINEGEEIVAVLLVEKTAASGINHKSTQKLDVIDSKIKLNPQVNENWSVLVFVEGFSNGTIRGIHVGEDDLQPNAPASGDLLNAKAMEKFILLTHEHYYLVLKKYFGNTVFAMFTDEPGIMGRCHQSGMMPWTKGFLTWYLEQGNSELDLPALWFDAGEQTEIIRRNYRKAVNLKLEETYYKPISKWCEDHKIAFTGHPEKSDEIGFMKHFHIPGQDIVWRWVAPEDGKGLEGEHSTMAKCSSDAARHYGKKRNSNECFGCCGPDGNNWAFSVDDMKWYLDWMFVRGVNLLYPHAFYYSIKGEVRYNERPPDVGPNNVWWKYYNTISDYIKRMSWLMTDSINQAKIAVLCEEDHLPWRAAKVLFQNQLEFNYLEDHLLVSEPCLVVDGKLKIRDYKYDVLIVENIDLISVKMQKKLELFTKQGGVVIVYSGKGNENLPIYGVGIKELNQIPEVINKKLKQSPTFTPACNDLRMSHIVKNGVHFYVLVNEGEKEIKGTLAFCQSGGAEEWDPWKGIISEMEYCYNNQQTAHIPVKLQRRESKIICIDPEKEALIKANVNKREEHLELIEVEGDWKVCGIPQKNEMVINKLTSWTEWDGINNFTGTLTYNIAFNIDLSQKVESVELDLGEAHEIAHVYINGTDAGFKLWSPYVFDIKDMIKVGENTLRVEITNCMANSLSNAKVNSGLLGPVMLKVQ